VSEASVVVVVGNPQAGSRTAAAAGVVGERLAVLLGETDLEPTVTVIDLADVARALVGWGDPVVAGLKRTVSGATALVVASPTYKASFTGLLKLFLDQFGSDELAGLPTVAVMSGGSAAHTLALDTQLRPVLVEIGASLPTRGVYFAGPEIDEPAAVVDRWWVVAAPILRRVRWS